MTNTNDLGEYAYALKADRDASATVKWAGPIIVFGWVILVAAAIVVILAFLGTFFAMGQADSTGDSLILGLAVYQLFAAVIVALVFVLQAAVVLVLGYYVRMRGNWIKYECASQLQSH